MHRQESSRSLLRSAGAFVLIAVSLVAVAWGALAQPVFRETEQAVAGPAVEKVEKESAADRVTVITGARVFTGREVIPRGTVAFRGGEILAVGQEAEPGVESDAEMGAEPSAEMMAGAEVIDGSGKTVMPGMIDGHVHAFGEALERSAAFGVTTVLDMFTSPDMAAQRRAEQKAGEAHGRADLLSAGYLATAPGGHGTQYGMPVPTLTESSQVEAWVAARVKEGSDYIKIVLEDGSLYGAEIPTLDDETLRALVRHAHEAGKRAVVHVSAFRDAQRALDAGADGLVHLFRDREGTDEWVKKAAEAGIFVTPTLTVLEGTAGTASGAELADDERVARYLRAAEIANLQQSFPRRSATPSMEPAFRTVRALHEAGVPILAGTDAPNPGTWYGASMLRELELLVAAGLTPVEALTAATAAPAAAFGLDDRGILAPGRRADLVLIDGDPTRDVVEARNIERVWKEGREIDRTLKAASASPGESAGAEGPGTPRETGLVSDFESGEMTAAYGAGWAVSTDDMMGGKSTVELEVVSVDGGEGEGKALEVRGEINEGFPFPWAGAMLFLGDRPMAPADFSAAEKLVFRVWAEEETRLRVMVFASSLGRMPSEQPFTAGPGWSEVTLDLAGFPGLDPAGLSAVLFSGGPSKGPFHFRLDDVAFR